MGAIHTHCQMPTSMVSVISQTGTPKSQSLPDIANLKLTNDTTMPTIHTNANAAALDLNPPTSPLSSETAMVNKGRYHLYQTALRLRRPQGTRDNREHSHEPEKPAKLNVRGRKTIMLEVTHQRNRCTSLWIVQRYVQRV
jgi:hypothetical protein